MDLGTIPTGVRRLSYTAVAKLLTDPLLDWCGTLDRDELVARCRTDGSVLEFGDDETVTIPPLADPGAPHADTLNLLSGTYRTQSPFVCTTGPATLMGEQPLCVLQDGRIVTEVAEAMRQNVKWRLFDFLQENGPLQTLAALRGPGDHETPDFERVFPLARYPDTSYYHWILGTLGRVRALDARESVDADDVTILIQSDPPSWIEESLRLVGCDPADCVEWPGGVATCSELIVPSHNVRHHTEYNPSRAELRWLRDRMRNNSEASVDQSERIYVSRRDADRRHVQNAEEVRDVVEAFDFRVCTPSSLSLSEQIELFAGASVVVGPHGGGMTNVLFGDDLRILELYPDSRIRPFFYALASQLGHEYDYTVEQSDSAGNVRVDLDRFESKLREIVS